MGSKFAILHYFGYRTSRDLRAGGIVARYTYSAVLYDGDPLQILNGCIVMPSEMASD